MARYDRRYDYGLRGSREAGFARYDRELRARSYDFDLRSASRDSTPLRNRVAQRYNADYVYGWRGDTTRRNLTNFGGDRPLRMGSEQAFRTPYNTIGGTSTWRGAPRPTGYTQDPSAYDWEWIPR